MIGLPLLALVIGLLVELPGGWFGLGVAAEEERLEQVDRAQLREMANTPGQLTVVNLAPDGHPDAEKLAEILEQFEQQGTFSDRVVYAELELTGAEAETRRIELEEFAGELEFYAEGKRLGRLRDETRRPVVRKTVQRYLDGLVKRYGPGWLPEVEGMQRADGNETVLHIEPADEETR